MHRQQLELLLTDDLLLQGHWGKEDPAGHVTVTVGNSGVCGVFVSGDVFRALINLQVVC